MGDNKQTPGGHLSRRRLLVSGTVGVLAFAGCAGDSAGTDPEPDTPTETPTETATPEPTEQAALTEPVEPTDEDRCAVCNMMPAKYPDWNAQLTLELGAGTRAHFCSPGCLTAFVATPGEFVEGATRDQLVGAWAHDVETTALVDATAADWVLELNADRIDAPMMANPLPFGDEADAQAYVDQYADRTAHDIVGFDTFDVALASHFRATHLPAVDHPSVLEPAMVPDGESCGVCKMEPAMFPDANSQVSFEDGERTYFCSPGCLTAFYADPGTFEDERVQADIVGAWDHDYGTKERIDALAASYVLETDAERVDLPMMTNPVPFDERTDAIAYVDQYDDLAAEDVRALTGFTVDVATTYRGKFF